MKTGTIVTLKRQFYGFYLDPLPCGCHLVIEKKVTNGRYDGPLLLSGDGKIRFVPFPLNFDYGDIIDEIE